MPVVIEVGRARIDGAARVEDAEALVSFLENTPDGEVDLAGASHLHTAVLQVLMAYRPDISAMPDQPMLLALSPFLLGQPTPDLIQAGPVPECKVCP